MNSGVEYIKNYSVPLNRRIDQLLSKYLEQSQRIDLGYASKVLENIIELSSGGKKVRGGLIKLAYEICKAESISISDEEKIIDISAAIEIFHTSILVHDDIMDRASKRRNIETIHSRYSKDKDLHFGEGIAICGGDAGFYISWDIILNSKNDLDVISNVAKLYSEYCIRLMYGQILDITGDNLKPLSEDDVNKVYKYKTAEYTGVLPLLIGYSLASCKDKKIFEALKSYGYAFGWIFQLQDDLIDVFSEESETGKLLGKDIEEGKNTLLMCHFDKSSTPQQKIFKDKIFGKPKLRKDDLEQMRKMLVDTGSLEYIETLKKDYLETGRREIRKITTNNNYQKILNDLIEFVATRKS